MAVFPFPMALASGSGTVPALAFTLDGTAQDNAASATQVYTMTGAISTGGLIIVVGGLGTGGGPTLTGVVDSKGNTYAVNSTGGSTNPSIGIAMAPCTVALAASDTVTLTWSGSQLGHACAVGRINNPKAGTSAAFDVQVTSSGSSANPTATTAALAQSNEIIIGAVTSTNTATGTEDTNFTNFANLTYKAAGRLLIAGYRIVSSSSGVTYAPTLPISATYAEAIATYRGQ